ncbi:MAG: uncharacterized protein JWN11_1785 [Hyphomicrobiales bacterium]|nr:uncharacterized protein [Hyphomicrobiales bacterium]
MLDRYEGEAAGLSAPAHAGFPITPNDNADLAEVTRAVYVGGAGAVSVLMASGQTVTFAAVAASVLLPIRVRRVLASGTTATNLVGLC